MSQWKDRDIIPKPGATKSAAMDETIPAIQHGQWRRRGGMEGDVLEDAFVNPDNQSPVAAIIVARGESTRSNWLNVHVVPRPGKSSKLDAALDKAGLSFGGGQLALLDETQAGLRALGVEPPDWSTAVTSQEGIAQHRDLIITQLRQVIAAFRTSPNLLSKHADIRTAMVDTMQQKLASLSALGDSSLPSLERRS